MTLLFTWLGNQVLIVLIFFVPQRSIKVHCKGITMFSGCPNAESVLLHGILKNNWENSVWTSS